jgi:hypothetical protein
MDLGKQTLNYLVIGFGIGVIVLSSTSITRFKISPTLVSLEAGNAHFVFGASECQQMD